MVHNLLRKIVGLPLKHSRPSYQGKSGVTYVFHELIQQRPKVGSVWEARAHGDRYILKEVPKSYYENFTENIWPRLAAAEPPHVRLPCDTIPNTHIFVYRYLSHDFLEVVKAGLPKLQKRRVLKSILQGLAELHEHDIVHLDVKPDNVLVEVGDEWAIKAVQLHDLEDAVRLKPGKIIKGSLAGNENWRSPEAHVRARLNKPTDMYSFGAICLYAMLNRIVFGRDADFDQHVAQGNTPIAIRMMRQAAYFGDEEGCQGLRKHFAGDDGLPELVDLMWEQRHSPEISYVHFSAWPEIDDEPFKDLVLKLMSLDPAKRLSANAAL